MHKYTRNVNNYSERRTPHVYHFLFNCLSLIVFNEVAIYRWRVLRIRYFVKWLMFVGVGWWVTVVLCDVGGWMDRRMDGWIDGWMDGWMDRKVSVWVAGRWGW